MRPVESSLGNDRDLEQLIPEVTWDRYLALEPPDGLRFEYDDGRLLSSPTGIAPHDLLIPVLLEIFGEYERRTGGKHAIAFPPHSFFMPPGIRDYQPDVGVITDAPKDQSLEDRTIGAPNLAIEILLHSTARRDRGLKAARYFQEGTSEYWLFDPEARTAEFFRRGRKGWTAAASDARRRYRTPLLPGFVLDLEEMWRRLDRKLRRPKSRH